MPSRRLVLAIAVFAAAIWGLFLAFPVSPHVDDPADALHRYGDGQTAEAELRGHPSVAAEDETRARGRGVVAGLVLDAEGHPAVGVPVRARREWEPYRRNVLELPAPGDGPRAPPFDRSAVSDAHGRFRIEGLEEEVRTWVWALPAPPHASARALATPGADRAAHVILHLGRGAPLRGRVVDASGRGTPAWIDATLPYRNEHRAAGAGTWCVRGQATAPDGRFVLDAVPDGVVWLSAFAPGVGARTLLPVSTPAGHEVLVRLGEQPGATLHGYVRDVAGEPIAGARLFARVRVRRLGFGHEEMAGLVARSDEAGRYRIANLPTGRIQEIRVEAQDFRESRYLGSGIRVEANETIPFDVVLLRGCTLEGRVVDELGRPVENARVWAAGLRPPGSPPITSRAGNPVRVTDAAGRYRIEGLFAGRKSLQVNHPERQQAGYVLVEGADGAVVQVPDVRMVPKSTEPQRAASPSPTATSAVEEEGAIEGRLLAPDGSPVPGLEVQATSPAGAETVVIAGTLGFFRVDLALPGTWRLQARDRRGNALGEEVAVEVRAERVTRDVQVRTYESHTLAGGVVDEHGEPVAGVSVSAHVAGADRSRGPGGGTWTDLDGEFEITVFQETEWSLRVDGRTCPGRYESGRRGIRLVHRTEPTRQVVIVVRDPLGTPILGARVVVRWTPPGRRRNDGRSARPGGGRYYCRVPQAVETVDVEVEAALDEEGRPLDVAPFEVQGIALGDDPIEVQLERGRSLLVLVTDPQGRPVAGAMVCVRPVLATARREHWHAGGADVHRTDANGRLTAVGLSPDASIVVLVVTEGPHANPPPVLASQDARRIDVRLPRSTTVEGRVLDAAGGPLAGVTVHARLAPPSSERWRRSPVFIPSPPYQGWGVVTDARGRFLVDRVPAGTTLTVSVGGREQLRTSVTDVAAGTTDLVLRPAPGARVRGRCVEASPWLAEGRLTAELHDAADTGDRPRSQITSGGVADDGSFDLGPVPAGRYRLVVTSGVRILGDILVDALADAPVSGLEVPLPTRYQLEVRVLGADVGGFLVTVLDDEGEGTSSTLDPSGVKRFTLLDDRPRRVIVRREGDERIGVVDGVRPSEGPVRVTLGPGLSIAGRIEGAPADKVGGFAVLVEGSGVATVVRPAADGAFRVVGLPHGTYRVRVLPRGVPGRIDPLENVPAGRENLVLVFKPR